MNNDRAYNIVTMLGNHSLAPGHLSPPKDAFSLYAPYPVSTCL